MGTVLASARLSLLAGLARRTWPVGLFRMPDGRVGNDEPTAMGADHRVEVLA